jgi:hypothetical protein
MRKRSLRWLNCPVNCVAPIQVGGRSPPAEGLGRTCRSGSAKCPRLHTALGIESDEVANYCFPSFLDPLPIPAPLLDLAPIGVERVVGFFVGPVVGYMRQLQNPIERNARSSCAAVTERKALKTAYALSSKSAAYQLHRSTTMALSALQSSASRVFGFKGSAGETPARDRQMGQGLCGEQDKR